MENQHRKIKGYRELSQYEIDLMNEIKGLGVTIEQVYDKLQSHLEAQADAADIDEIARLGAAEPTVWADTGKTQLQMGLMALTRAVAQPAFF